MTFSDNIKKLRLRLKMSQRAFSKALGLTPSVACYYERGHRRPGPKTIFKMIKLAKDNGIKIRFEDIRDE